MVWVGGGPSQPSRVGSNFFFGYDGIVYFSARMYQFVMCVCVRDWKRVVHAFGMVSSWHATQLREIDPAADLGRFAF